MGDFLGLCSGVDRCGSENPQRGALVGMTELRNRRRTLLSQREVIVDSHDLSVVFFMRFASLG